MAKLTAGGRTELVRLSKTQDHSDAPAFTKERTTIAFMSDGKILKKWDVWFKPNSAESLQGQTESKMHSYGWKVFSKWHSPEQKERQVDRLKSQGYVEEAT